MADSKPQNTPDPLQALWDNDALMDKLAREAIQDAVQKHKQNGQSIVVWQDGKIVTLAPSEILDPDPR